MTELSQWKNNILQLYHIPKIDLRKCSYENPSHSKSMANQTMHFV